MDNSNFPIRLHLPNCQRSTLSFCDENPEALTEWCSDLPMANIQEASRLLYVGMRELLQWYVAPGKRLAMLEVIRPYVHAVCDQLEQHTMDTRRRLSRSQLQMATLTQTLHGNLANSYLIATADHFSQKHSQPLSEIELAVVMHRALTESGGTILRAYQHYVSAPRNAWMNLNQCYRLVDAAGLNNFRVTDSTLCYLENSTLSDAYIRVLLLGSAKPNKLRAPDMAIFYNAIELWTELCSLIPEHQAKSRDSEPSLFVVDLNRDLGPVYRQHLREPDKHLLCAMDPQLLVDRLRHWAVNPSGKHPITVPGRLSDELINHAVQSWGILWQRSFRRSQLQASHGIEFCVGLSAIHYFSAGQQSFDTLMENLRPRALADEEFSSHDSSISAGDVWNESLRTAATSMASFESSTDKVADFIKRYHGDDVTHIPESPLYPTFKTDIINSGPGGYCLEWPANPDAVLQTGEIIGIREQAYGRWSIAVVRWIRQSQEQKMQFGLELIAPRGEAAAVQLRPKTGTPGPFLRALYIPGIKATAQPPTLILPRLPFRTGNKVELVHIDINGKQQLVKRLTSTNSFSQFQFRAAGARERSPSSTPTFNHSK